MLQTDNGTKPRRRKRKGNGISHAAAKDAGIIEISIVREQIDYLVSRYREAEGAAIELKEAIKAAAEQANVKASNLKKFIAARAGDKFAEKKSTAQQLALLFEEVGE